MKIAEHFSRGVLANNIERVKILFTNLEEIFDERYFNLEDTSHKLTAQQIKDNNTLKRGSLMYFLVESHSTSRRYMHKELKDFLEKVGAKK